MVLVHDVQRIDEITFSIITWRLPNGLHVISRHCKLEPIARVFNLNWDDHRIYRRLTPKANPYESWIIAYGMSRTQITFGESSDDRSNSTGFTLLRQYTFLQSLIFHENFTSRVYFFEIEIHSLHFLSHNEITFSQRRYTHLDSSTLRKIQTLMYTANNGKASLLALVRAAKLSLSPFPCAIINLLKIRARAETSLEERDRRANCRLMPRTV